LQRYSFHTGSFKNSRPSHLENNSKLLSLSEYEPQLASNLTPYFQRQKLDSLVEQKQWNRGKLAHYNCEDGKNSSYSSLLSTFVPAFI